jgi:2-hydroxychromene-2-carboxylate isomerase
MSEWGGFRYAVFKRMIAEKYNLDEDDIKINTTLEYLGIDPDDFTDFIIASADKIKEETGYSLRDEDILRWEAHRDKYISELYDAMLL